MSFEEIKDALKSLDQADQKRLITEVVPQMWGDVCDDMSCALKLKELVDKDMMRPYDERYMDEMMFMGGI